MKIIPILTEKSLGLAKTGKYSFWVDPGLNKNQIRREIGIAFEVHVVGISTAVYKKSTNRNMRGRNVTEAARKKAMVRLAKDEKISVFEVKENKKK
jgi:ribosomal protein L23